MIVCVPSRGRPEKLKLLLETMAAARTKAQIYVRLDDDDPELVGYCRFLRSVPVAVVIDARTDVAGAMREALEAYPDEDCYGLVGDDTAIRTYRWDETLRETAGQWRVAYPDDGLKGRQQATHPFIGGEFLRAIGFWALPGLSHLFTDTVWDFLGRQYGNLTYCPTVLVEHLHWSAGKSVRDAIYNKPTAHKDQQCFLNWTAQYKIDSALAARIAASAAAA